jgi:hypothetical protein
MRISEGTYSHDAMNELWAERLFEDFMRPPLPTFTLHFPNTERHWFQAYPVLRRVGWYWLRDRVQMTWNVWRHGECRECDCDY